MRGKRIKLVGLTVAMATLIVAAAALAASTVKVSRCGYAKAEYGRSGVYPWHISCAEGESLAVGAFAKRHKTIPFTAPATGDSAAVLINGKWWVCGGEMGDYFCGYPYRPLKLATGTFTKGPFTKGVEWVTCKQGTITNACATKTLFYQP